MQHVLDSLIERLPTLSPKLRAAGKIILDKPNLVATTSMRELARQAGVTPPTMIRLVNSLGYDNYQQFKQVFLNVVNNFDFEQRASSLQQISKAEGEAAIIHGLLQSSHTNIGHFYQHLSEEDICEAADLIIKAKTVYVIASGSSHWMAAYMQYVGKMAIPNLRVARTSGNELVESLASITNDDIMIAISYSPYIRQTIETIEFGLNKGARLIYLSDSIAAPLASAATVLIRQSTDSPQYFPSMVSVVAAIETFLAVIVSRCGDDTLQKIAEYTAIRQRGYF